MTTLDELVKVFCAAQGDNLEIDKGVAAVVRAMTPAIAAALAWGDMTSLSRDPEYLRRTARFFINEIIGEAKEEKL